MTTRTSFLPPHRRASLPPSLLARPRSPIQARGIRNHLLAELHGGRAAAAVARAKTTLSERLRPGKSPTTSYSLTTASASLPSRSSARSRSGSAATLYMTTPAPRSCVPGPSSVKSRSTEATRRVPSFGSMRSSSIQASDASACDASEPQKGICTPPETLRALDRKFNSEAVWGAIKALAEQAFTSIFAEPVGFEPTEGLRPLHLSRVVH